MAHNYAIDSNGTIMCSWCGDVIGVAAERGCPNSQGKNKD